jgi:putative MATE family efflux protein
MKDLTQGPIARHLIEMAAPTAIGMLVQTLYFLVDLYFVARLGDHALAGVGSAGNATFITLALTQMLGVATVALIAHAVGRKDKGEANLIFNQSLLLSVLCAALTLAGGYALTRVYMGAVGADAATASAGATYLYWYLPGLALQFALIAMGSGLRGTGIVQPTIIVQMLSVVVNIILAPVLIAGWGTGHALGVAGAGLASSIAVAAGVALMSLYFLRLEKYVGFHADQWRPRFAIWMRMLNLGLPAGGEFALMFVFIAVIYWIIRDFGAAAQAGFGVAMRLMQAIFLPAMAIAFATAPIAGQNFGAGFASRVRETFRSALLIGSAIMVALTLFCQWRPDLLMRFFTMDPQVIAVGAQYLRIVSWNFVATGIIFTCSGMFQALGNTWPSLLSTGSRVVTFVIPAIWLSRQPNFRLEHLWYLSVGTVTLQAVTSLWLLATQFRRRLQPGNAPHVRLASM